MHRQAVLDRINHLLESEDGATVTTSIRLPAALREAAALAGPPTIVPTAVRAEAGWDRSEPRAAAIDRFRIADMRSTHRRRT